MVISGQIIATSDGVTRKDSLARESSPNPRNIQVQELPYRHPVIPSEVRFLLVYFEGSSHTEPQQVALDV